MYWVVLYIPNSLYSCSVSVGAGPISDGSQTGDPKELKFGSVDQIYSREIIEFI